MSYILKRLPELKNLKKELKYNPNNIKHYSRYDTFIGDENSINFILKEIKKYLK